MAKFLPHTPEMHYLYEGQVARQVVHDFYGEPIRQEVVGNNTDRWNLLVDNVIASDETFANDHPASIELEMEALIDYQDIVPTGLKR